MIFTKRKTIGVFISKLFRAFDDAFFLQLTKEAKKYNVDIFVFMTAGYYISKNEYDIQERNILKFAPLDQMDGIIAVPSTFERGEFRNSIYEMLRNVKCPVVIVREENEEFNCAYTDNQTSMRQIMKHLLEDHGLTKICFQNGQSSNNELDIRYDTYVDEMLKHGISVTEDMICSGDMWTTSGDRAFDAFFSDKDNIPEAVVCANDYMAMGLTRILQDRGYQVPEDVIITGFDNISGWALDVPTLTTIQPDYEQMVIKAMELLIKGMKGESQNSPQKIPIGGTFIKGESCGCGRRHKDYYKTISERATILLERENDQDAVMNNLSIDLGGCDDLSDLHAVLTSMRTMNPIVRDHYLCLFGEPGNLLEESNDKACLVHAMRDHWDGGMPMVTFDRKKILPPMVERIKEPQVFFIKLLHQRHHNFGYSVYQYEDNYFPSRCFVQTNAMISVALENMHRKMELMNLYEERRKSSITDILTGLFNRRGLMEKLEPQWPGFIGIKAAFVCIDIDRLKKINDTYGHAAGDFAIRLLGQAIKNTLPENAIGARVGGDEFLVFIKNVGEYGAEWFLDDMNKELDRLNLEEKRSFTVRASCGYHPFFLTETDTIEGCIQASDKVLYQNKEKRHHLEELREDENKEIIP